VDENGKVDVSQLPAGAMYTANGEWVIAKPDEASWDKFQQTHKVAADQAKELEADMEVMRARGLECSIDHKMFSDPVKTPCCGQVYCRTCIENALIDSDFMCPNCGEQCLLESLESDAETQNKVKAFQEEMKSEKRKKQTEEANKKSPSVAPDSPAKSPKPSDSCPGSADGSANGSTNGKKRHAEEELENTHKPAGPGEMKQAGSKEATPAQPSQSNTANNKGTPNAAPTMPMANNLQDFAMQMNMMAGMPGMPGMPGGGMMNPMMMGMNPMMMGGPGAGGMNPMMNPMMGMGMGGMNGNMNGHMNGNMNGGFGYGPQGQQGFGGQNGGGPPAGPRAWQQQQQHHQQHHQQQWGMNNGMRNQNGAPQGPAADGGAYFRQPVNPGRAQNRGRGQRSVDYKQLGQQ
jgi:protein MPE1